MSFFEELKKRHVFKVGASYAIVAWLLVQAADVFFPALHVPDWATTLVAGLVLLGFPGRCCWPGLMRSHLPASLPAPRHRLPALPRKPPAKV